MSPRRLLIVQVLFALTIAAGGALRIGAARGPVLDPLRRDYAALGQNLREFGLFGWNEKPTTHRAPAFPALLAVVESPALDLRLAWVHALIGAAEIVLVGSLAWALHSPAAGLAAAALTAFYPGLLPAVASHNIEPFFGFLVLLVAAASALWARRPSPANACLLGLSIAVSLLCRATLFLFPVALLAFSRILRLSPRRALSRGLMVVALSYGLLAPWIARNYVQFRRFVPLETGPSWHTLFAASAGCASYPRDSGVLLKLDPSLALSPDLLAVLPERSARNIAEHPLGYLRGCLTRLGYELSLHPFLFLLASLAPALCGANSGIIAVAVLAGYFLAIHSLMATQARFFDPLLPSLFVLCGCALAALAARAERSLAKPAAAQGAPAFSRRRELGLRLAVLLPASAIYLLTVGFLTFELALTLAPCRLSPGPLTSLRCGQRRLSTGDPRAEEAFESALRQADEDARTPATLMAEILVYRSFYGPDDARRATLLARAVDAAPERAVNIGLRLQENGGFDKAASVFAALVAAFPKEAAYRIDLGIAEAGAGRLSEAGRHLEAAATLAPENPDAWANLGAVLEGQGRFRKALQAYDCALARSGPDYTPIHIRVESMRKSLLSGRPELAGGRRR